MKLASFYIDGEAGARVEGAGQKRKEATGYGQRDSLINDLNSSDLLGGFSLSAISCRHCRGLDNV